MEWQFSPEINFRDLARTREEDSYLFFHNKALIAEFDTRLEYEAFSNIFKLVRNSILVSTTSKKRISYLDKLLNDSTVETELYRINIEPFILRLRLIYELYKNKISIKFGNLICLSPLPSQIIGEVMLGNDFKHLKVCRFIHKYPAVDKEIVMDEFSNENIEEILLSLIKSDLIGLSYPENKLYFIGRDPLKHKLTRFNWTEQWGFKQL